MKNFFKILLTFFLFFLLFDNKISAQDFDKVEIITENISDNIYMLKGAGGNIGLQVGQEAVFIVDTQYAPLTEKLLKAIRAISDKPIKFVVNTHWHGDHTGGNENFAKKGATVVAHENVIKRMSSEQFMQAFSRKVPPSKEEARPDIVYKNELSFVVNGQKIWVFHVDNAHTDGDSFVFFPESNVIHLGDTYFQGKYPFIDISSGGSIDGMINAANKAIMIIDEDTKIIPGHGPISNKQELVEYRNMMLTIRDRVRKAIRAGLSFEEIQSSNLSKDFDDTWGQGFIKPEKFIDIIFTDLSRE